jgi:ribonuclease HII
MSSALSTGVGIVSHSEIDRLNILRATMHAMAEAVSKLSPVPEHVLVDGPADPLGGATPCTAIVGGDRLCFSIAAASIVAKVTRDRLMAEYDSRYPGYGFARHKGYGTSAHLAALRELGPCEIHRRSFRAR